jgi:hypothetical protein
MTHMEARLWFTENTMPDTVVVSAPRRSACNLPTHTNHGRVGSETKKRKQRKQNEKTMA